MNGAAAPLLARPAANILNAVGPAVSLVIFVAGAVLQSLAHRSSDAFFVALVFLVAGLAVSWLIAGFRYAETRAFMFMYVMCLLVGGLLQNYSVRYFGRVQSTIDAAKFMSLIALSPPVSTLESLRSKVNSPLAVMAWQYVYLGVSRLGFRTGSYVGVMFNAMVMGLVAVFTVKIGRLLFGDDGWRLRRIGTLCGLCGLFLLLGSVLIRDCFTALFNVMVLWALVRWLKDARLSSLATAVFVTICSIGAVAYLRYESIVLFGVYWVCALVMFMGSRLRGYLRFAGIVIVLCWAAVFLPYLGSYLKATASFQERKYEYYASASTLSSRPHSLGVRYVVGQPMPVRLIAGTFYLAVFPIPLWGYFRPGLFDNYLVKGYNGLFQQVAIPLIMAGVFSIVRAARRNLKAFVPHVFVLVYFCISLASVVMTSLEQRHLAQFLPAILAVAPAADTRERETRTRVVLLGGIWIVFLAVIHALWLAMKS